MTDRLAAFVRVAATELRRLRGEVITALAVAAVVAVVVDETAAVVIGIAAIVVAAAALLVLSSRLRSSSKPSRPGARPGAHSPGEEAEGEESPIPIARARLVELASQMALETPPVETRDVAPGPEPRVSMVVPCFNDARFVAEALQSVIQQTYGNWECLVVDDASTDTSWDVIQETVGGDARFHTMRLDSNSGSGAARNRGLEAATGDYVAFLDADDLLLGESLADRVAAVTRHLDDPLVSGSFCAVRSEPEEVSLSSLPDRRHATQEPFIDFVVAGGECPFTLHAPLVEIGRIRALGGFDESMTTGAVDWDLWYRMLRNGDVFVPSKTLGAIYRQKQGGITRSNKAGHTEASARLIRDAFTTVDPAVMVSPTTFPMPEPLGSYQAKLVVADRAVRFAAMALAEGDPGDMRKTLDVLETGTWPLLDRHLDWDAVVGRGVTRVLGLRPRDVPELADALAPFVFAVRQATAEVTG